jgi:hypothetical protein
MDVDKMSLTSLPAREENRITSLAGREVRDLQWVLLFFEF